MAASGVYADDGSLRVTTVGGLGTSGINDLNDVTIDTPADNEVLAYNTATSEFINQTAAEAGLAPTASPTFTGTVTSGAIAATSASGNNVLTASHSASTGTASALRASTSSTGSAANYVANLSSTWNTSGTVTAFLLAITDTLSNAASLIANWTVGGTSMFSVTKAGLTTTKTLAVDDDAYAASWDGSLLVPTKNAIYDKLEGKAYFQANNSGAAQTGIADNVATKVNFGTEEFDNGGFYNAGTSTWTPPAGPIRISASIRISGTFAANDVIQAILAKNGSAFKRNVAGFQSSTTSSQTLSIVALDVANGTDAYTILAQGNTTAGGTVDMVQAAEQTFFSGEQI